MTFLATHNLETGDTSKVFLILCLAKMTIYFFTFNTSNLQNFTITRSGMSIMMFLAFKKIFIWNFYDIDLLQGLLTAIYLTNGYKIRKFPRTESQLKILYFFCDMCFCIFQRTFSSCCLFCCSGASSAWRTVVRRRNTVEGVIRISSPTLRRENLTLRRTSP